MNNIKRIRFPAPVADDMIRAIQNGEKTMMRLIIKPQPKYCMMTQAGLLVSEQPIKVVNGLVNAANANVTTWAHLPYRSGDIMYVQETWCDNGNYEIYPFETERFWYKADRTNNTLPIPEWFRGWNPSIHMPREAARIFLRVINVRVERLQEITAEQARKEGCNGWFVASTRDWDKNPDFLIEFRHFWNSAVPKKVRALYGWDANPYVLCVSFEKISKEEALCA